MCMILEVSSFKWCALEMRHQKNKNENKLDDKLRLTDSHLKDQLDQINSLMYTINANILKTKDPFRAEQTDRT